MTPKIQSSEGDKLTSKPFPQKKNYEKNINGEGDKLFLFASCP